VSVQEGCPSPTRLQVFVSCHGFNPTASHGDESKFEFETNAVPCMASCQCELYRDPHRHQQGQRATFKAEEYQRHTPQVSVNWEHGVRFCSSVHFLSLFSKSVTFFHSKVKKLVHYWHLNWHLKVRVTTTATSRYN
jgi:hypothetical protein